MATEQRDRSKIIWITLGAVTMAGIGLVALLLYTTGGAAALPKLGTIPDAQFTTQDGREFSLAELKGTVWVGDLIFTTCAGQCLRMTSQFYRVQEEIKNDPGVKLVSISVDPDRDTPERLTWYAGQAMADPARWIFLRADLPTIRKVATEGLKLVVENEVEGEPSGILHSDRFVLVDQDLQIRGYYDGLDPVSVEELTKAIKSLRSAM